MRKVATLLMMVLCLPLFAQIKTGTLKVFSEIPGITIFLDGTEQSAGIQEIKDIPIGSHYLKAMSGNVVVYSEVIEIKENSVTTILMKKTDQVQNNIPEKGNDQNVDIKSQGNGSIGKTGTLKIFSELTGVVVYLDENKQGTDVKQINDVPVGSHYLKVLLNNVSVYGEVLEIKEGAVTTILVKNTGQVQEKILESKTTEQEEYANKKLDVILSRGMSTSTKGYSNLFPGYYGYWGTNSSTSTSVETSDWKIIQGGVKEISEYNFSSITGNTDLQKSIQTRLAKEQKLTTVSALIFLGAFIPSAVILADMVAKKPFLHPVGTTAKNWEVGVLAGGIVVCTISYGISMKKPYSGHYTTVEKAAQEAREFNRKLKTKLGLPDSYDMNR
jgi:hypothetical protein